MSSVSWHFKCPKFRHFKWNGKFFLEPGKAFYLSVRRYKFFIFFASLRRKNPNSHAGGSFPVPPYPTSS